MCSNNEEKYVPENSLLANVIDGLPIRFLKESNRVFGCVRLSKMIFRTMTEAISDSKKPQ